MFILTKLQKKGKEEEAGMFVTVEKKQMGKKKMKKQESSKKKNKSNKNKESKQKAEVNTKNKN